MNPGSSSDESLMRDVAAGRRDQMAPLVRRHASALLTFIERMVGDHHRGEELFQEVFLQVWLKRAQYQFPRPFRAWLFAIAANHCRAAFRRARLDVEELVEAGPAAPAARGPTPLEAALDTETACLVSAAVAALPARQRAVVVLRLWNELSYREISEIVECSEATARSHMHLGLCALRAHLEPRMRE